MCSACNSLRNEWKRMSGRGSLWTVGVAHPPLLPAYGEVAPYKVIRSERDLRGDKFAACLYSVKRTGAGTDTRYSLSYLHEVDEQDSIPF